MNAKYFVGECGGQSLEQLCEQKEKKLLCGLKFQSKQNHLQMLTLALCLSANISYRVLMFMQKWMHE